MLLSLEPDELFTSLVRQAVNGEPCSISILEMPLISQNKKLYQYYLHVGLTNGILVRSIIDSGSGELFDIRERLIGNKPVKLQNVFAKTENAVMAMSSRSWLTYYYQNNINSTPISYLPIAHVATFSSKICEGFAVLNGN
jgi:splicing factor 3B subunit 3